MRIGLLGTGGVGRTLAPALSRMDNQVMLGTRDVAALTAAENESSFAAWHRDHDEIAVGTFAEAAAHGEVVINATAGAHSLAALDAAGADNLDDKILIEVANPLDFSGGMPPTLTVVNTDSLGEQIQRALPGTRVVKTLNTVNANVMVDPASVAGGDHVLFVCGDDDAAKAAVTGYLREWFGWEHVLDLGGISAARAAEMYLPLWVQMMSTLGTPAFNIQIRS